MRCIFFVAAFLALLQSAFALPSAPILAPRADVEHADVKGHSKSEWFGSPYGVYGGWGGLGLGGLGWGGLGLGGLGWGGFGWPALGGYYGLGYGYANLGLYGGYGLWKKDASDANKVDDKSS